MKGNSKLSFFRAPYSRR